MGKCNLNKSIRKHIIDHPEKWEFGSSRNFLNCEKIQLVKTVSGRSSGRWHLITGWDFIELDWITQLVIKAFVSGRKAEIKEPDNG